MRKLKEFIADAEGAIVWVVFALCVVVAFTGLAIGHKEIIGIAFGTLGVLLVSFITLTVVQDYRMTTRMRKANERTAADMI